MDKPFYWGGRWTTRAELKRERDAEWAEMSKAEQVAFDNLPYSSIPELSEARELIAEVRPHLRREIAAEINELLASADNAAAALLKLGQWLNAARQEPDDDTFEKLGPAEQAMVDAMDGTAAGDLYDRDEIARVALAAARPLVYREVQQKLVRCCHPSAYAAIDEMIAELEQGTDNENR